MLPPPTPIYMCTFVRVGERERERERVYLEKTSVRSAADQSINQSINQLLIDRPLTPEMAKAEQETIFLFFF